MTSSKLLQLNELYVTDQELREELINSTNSSLILRLNPRQLYDLELILNRGFSPLDGFMDEENYESVVNNVRLKDGTVWPIPVVLDVDDVSKLKIGMNIMLSDEYLKPIAVMTISSIYEPDKSKEVNSVYQTDDISHYGVRYILSHTGKYYLGGKVYGINQIDHYDFLQYRLTPNQLRDYFNEYNWADICAFQTRNPIHKAHFSMIENVKDEHGVNVLIHPVVGVTNDGDIDYVTRVRSYIKLIDTYGSNQMKLALLPLAMRMGGPREALLHAIVRKNYGCTHFIVGRHHAEPKDANGNDFYGAYDAQDFVKKYEDEIGIKMIPFKEMVYHEGQEKYLSIDSISDQENIKNISGTKFREMISKNEDVPEWFSFPEVIDEIKRGHKKNNRGGLTIFFTGLPSSGKSTLANMLYHALDEITDKKITLLDGDIIRNNLSKGLGFSKEDRITNVKRIGFVANEITKHGGIAICSAVAPYEEARKANRDLISQNGKYIEIYLSTPIEECSKRDVKGFYKKNKDGLNSNMTGIDDPYEVPINPEIMIDTSVVSEYDSLRIILKLISNIDS